MSVDLSNADLAFVENVIDLSTAVSPLLTFFTITFVGALQAAVASLGTALTAVVANYLRQEIEKEEGRRVWSAWGPWDSCSVPCGNTGTRSRSRTCPIFPGTSTCPGSATETDNCPANPSCK